MAKRRRNSPTITKYRTPNFFRRLRKYILNKEKVPIRRKKTSNLALSCYTINHEL